MASKWTIIADFGGLRIFNLSLCQNLFIQRREFKINSYNSARDVNRRKSDLEPLIGHPRQRWKVDSRIEKRGIRVCRRFASPSGAVSKLAYPFIDESRDARVASGGGRAFDVRAQVSENYRCAANGGNLPRFIRAAMRSAPEVTADGRSLFRNYCPI